MANNSGTTAMALLFGAALGVGIGILLAPDKGSKTREKLSKDLDDLKEEAKSKWKLLEKETKGKYATTKTELQDKVDEFLSNSSSKAEEAIVFLEQKLAELKKQNAKLQK